MNVAALMGVVNWLENGAIHVTPDGNRIGFDMEEWYGGTDTPEGNYFVETDTIKPWHTGCGTAMCIGGALEQFHPVRGEEAHIIAGLDEETADSLFYPWDSGGAYELGVRDEDYTPENCAKVIRNLIKTGEVDWSIIASVKEEA